MDIEAPELKRRLDAGESLNLIDVREPNEYEADNLGGLLLPLSELPQRLAELDGLQHEEIVLMCRSGARSEQAAKRLQAQGFTRVRNLLGGLLRYRQL